MDPTPDDLTTAELRELLLAPRAQLIDVRSIDAYNGWRLRGEPRGGHIAGARTLPFKWSSYIDWIEIVRAKEIRTEDPVVVYGDDRAETALVASQLRRTGYHTREYHLLTRSGARTSRCPWTVSRATPSWCRPGGCAR